MKALHCNEEAIMRCQMRRPRTKTYRVALLFVGLMTVLCICLVQEGMSAGLKGGTDSKPQANVDAGRSIFNGKGLCYYCHGMDGHLGKLPQLAPDTAAFIAQLDPKPADLINPKKLRLQSDKERARIIREGHLGTGMFPDTRMTDQDLKDTLAYLAALRKQGYQSKRSHP
jgi:hypothetical protein